MGRPLARIVSVLSLVVAMLVGVTPSSGSLGPFDEEKVVNAAGAAGDWLGYAVAISADTDVGGAREDGNGGTGYAFTSSDGSPDRLAVSATGAAGETFGASIAIDGNTLVVGSPTDDTGGVNRGSVSVFTRAAVGGEWNNSEQLITPAVPQTGEQFGFAVAVEGDKLVIGAPFYNTPVAGAGRVFVYTRNAGTGVWENPVQLQRAAAAPAIPAANDLFGRSVSISGGSIAIGVPAHIAGRPGAVDVWVDGGGGFAYSTTVTASDGHNNDGFGLALGIDGARMVVGAQEHDLGADTDEGRAYVYSGANFLTEDILIPTDSGAGDRFGTSAAISGTNVVVGAPNWDAGGGDEGQVYVFTPNGGGWGEERISASDGAAGDAFGIAVAVAGNMILVGAGRADIGVNADQGALYLYEPQAGGGGGGGEPPTPPGPVDGTVNETVPPGGTADTDHDGDGPTSRHPVETAVMSPQGGQVQVRTASQGDPNGYSGIGPPIIITAPDATPDNPLHITFEIDASVLPDDLEFLTIFRNGVVVPLCTGAQGVASPDPCHLPPTGISGGDGSITVLTSMASTWRFGIPEVFCEGLAPTLAGTHGSDVLVGTEGDDVIWAGGGDDTVLGLGGNDTICLGSGNDTAGAGPGRDVVRAGSGDDTIRGGSGGDRLTGGAGDDRIYGGQGRDSVSGGRGSDYVAGGRGPDVLRGGTGVDTAHGGPGSDRCMTVTTATSCE